MKKENNEQQKFEFLLKIDNNIICQRYFNVKNFNPKAVRSVEFYWFVQEIYEAIEVTLKEKTTDIITEFFTEDMSKFPEEKENFTITINKGETNLMTRIFPANLYPPRVRYSVDVRPQISYFLNGLSDVLSLREITHKYLDKVL
tara:strand:- start:397 stop:828 length:432 start_codon:yes stop_codon:yes gene_type:complete